MSTKVKQISQRVDNWFIDNQQTPSKEAWAEKFAEFIVQECDDYVESCWDVCEPWMRPGELLNLFEIPHDKDY